MRGQGFPRLRGASRGDLIVRVHVESCRKNLTAHQKELLHEALGSPTGMSAPTKKSGLFGRHH